MPTQDMASPSDIYGKGVRPVRLPQLHTAQATLAGGGWLRGCFFAVLAFAPLPFGSNRALWWSALALFTGALLVTYAWRVQTGRERQGLGLWAMLPVVLPYLAALTWGLIQTLPIPFDGLGHPLWPIAAEALTGQPIGQYISLDPHRTATGVMRLLTYAGIFWLALQFGRDRAFAETLLRVLTWIGLVYATYGVMMHVFGIERVLWYPKWAYEGFVTSTFVYRNAYATYAALGLVCSVGMLQASLRQALQVKQLNKKGWPSLIEAMTGSGRVPLVATIVLITAILQTGSRAGAVCTMIGLIAFLILSGISQLVAWRHTYLPLAAVAVTILVLLLINGTNVIDRIKSIETDRLERKQMYEITASAIGDAPVIGTGLGTFNSIFSMYRRPNYAQSIPPGNAHNSYLENALELGLPAAILLIASLAGILETCVVALKRRKRGRLFPVIGITCIVIVGLHSTVDFSLEIPAVSATFAAILGIACAQSFRSSRKSRLKFKVLADKPEETEPLPANVAPFPGLQKPPPAPPPGGQPSAPPSPKPSAR